MKHLSIVLAGIGILLFCSGLTWFLTSGAGKQVSQSLTPKPENFTELYFENHIDLLKTASPGAKFQFSYTIHNLEHQQMTYDAEVQVSEDPLILPNPNAVILQKEVIALDHDGSQTVPVQFDIPLFKTEREKVTVTLKNLNQSIHFWIVQAPFDHKAATASAEPVEIPEEDVDAPILIVPGGEVQQE